MINLIDKNGYPLTTNTKKLIFSFKLIKIKF